MPVRKRYCEARAKELLNGSGVTEPPVDVEAIAAALFLQVVQTDAGEHRWRAMLDRGQIRVNESDPPVAQRFSIGHEVGHSVLHREGFVFSAHDDPESDLYASDPDRELEREADYFSSVLLVPPRCLRKDVDAGMQPADLARRYQVSRDVIFIALEQHRLLHRIVQS